MKYLLFLILFTASHLVAAESASPLVIASEKKAPGLRLTLNKPDGWSTEWYTDEGPSLARIFNPTVNGREAFVVAATKIPAHLKGKTSDEMLDQDFFQQFAEALGADVAKRVKNPDWDGAYFEYPLPASAGVVGAKVRVKNWMLLEDGYLVQFQFYYYAPPELTPEQQQRQAESLALVYAAVLKSIRRD